MIRKTELQINDAEVEIEYCIFHTEIAWCYMIIQGEKYRADGLLEIPCIVEDLRAHHENLVLEENA